MLVPLPTWQLSQPREPTGMWLPGMATIAGIMVGVEYVAAFVLLWHSSQLVVVDGAYLWMSAIAGITEKSALVWHDAQLALDKVGMWLAGLVALFGSKENPAWHCEQSPLAGWEASATLNGPCAA